MKGLSLFAGAGIETYLDSCGIDIVVANEIVEKELIYMKHYITM